MALRARRPVRTMSRGPVVTSRRGDPVALG